ncbi:hypothetical protein HanPI659440_Chr06g0245681 [Helianthus annuus]|nr:hypothetical protein HanPI659440_Chr06g0245681 [Helianthus annuus]
MGYGSGTSFGMPPWRGSQTGNTPPPLASILWCRQEIFPVLPGDDLCL